MTIHSLPALSHPKAMIYDAAEAKISGGAFVETSNQGFNGKGYVAGYIDNKDANTEFTVDVPTDGDYFIALRYAAGAAGNWNTDRTVGLSINGESSTHVTFKSISARWDVWRENILIVRLSAGKNTINFHSISENDNSDCINLDQLAVWKFNQNPTLDGIVFDKNQYTVSEKNQIKTAIQEVDSNGMRKVCQAPLQYSSEDPSIAKVDSKTGVITGVTAGTTLVSAEGLGFSTQVNVTVLKNPTVIVDCKKKKRPVDPSTFGYILTPNYDVPDSRISLLGPVLNRETLPVQNFQAIGDLDGAYYKHEASILQRCLEAYKRAKALDAKWYMLLGMNPSWATSSGSPIETFKNKQTKSDIEQERFKQYIKDALQFFKDNGAKPDFANLTNEYWTGTERTFKGNWEALREVYPDFIPAVGPGGVGFSGIPDFYIPFASESQITIEGPGWHEFWVNDRYATLTQMKQWRKVIADFQAEHPEANGKYIIFEENNAGSKHPADWTRSMANVIRADVNKMIKGCLEARNANGMSDLLTTNALKENPAARRPIWWVYFMFSQLSGDYADVSTDITEDFTAVSSVNQDETKVIIAKNDCDGLVTIQLKNHAYQEEQLIVDLYKITNSENTGLDYQYSIDVEATDQLQVIIEQVKANEVWFAIIKKVSSAPSFFYPITPDDGNAVTTRPSFNWSVAQGATHYELLVAADKDFTDILIHESNLPDPSYQVPNDLLVGKTYYWSVIAVNPYGKRGFPNDTAYSFLVTENPNIPGQFSPYLPTIDAPNESVTPELQWSISYNADSYRVVISKNPDLSDPVVEIDNVTTVRDTGMYGPNTLGYYQIDNSLAYDTTYYWSVYAINKYGERKMGGPLRYFTTKTKGEAPVAFNLLSPQDGAKDLTARTVLSWEKSKNGFFYKLEIAEDENMEKPVIIRDRMIHNRYTVEPNVLLPGQTYYWRVTSYTKDLQHKQAASSGKVHSFTVESVPCSPLLYAEQPLNGCAKLWFQPSIGATSYKIKYGTNPGEYTATIKNVTSSPIIVSGLTNDTTYYFSVVAINEYGESSIWNERAVTPRQHLM